MPVGKAKGSRGTSKGHGVRSSNGGTDVAPKRGGVACRFTRLQIKGEIVLFLVYVEMLSWKGCYVSRDSLPSTHTLHVAQFFCMIAGARVRTCTFMFQDTCQSRKQMARPELDLWWGHNVYLAGSSASYKQRLRTNQ